MQQYQEEAKNELASVEKELATTPEEHSHHFEGLKIQKELLEELNLYYQQIFEDIDQKEEFEQEIEKTRDSLKHWSQTVPPDTFTPSFEQLDRFGDQLQINIRRIEVSNNTLKTLKTSLEESKSQFAQLEKERRRIKESQETNSDPSLAADLQRSLNTIRLESRIAQAKVFLTYNKN